MIRNIRLINILLLFMLCSCSMIEKFNAVESKVMYEEHYSTFNDVDYESGEVETYGLSITSKEERSSDFKVKYSIYPDISFEQSKLIARNESDRLSNPRIKMRRVSSFMSGRVSLLSVFGNFELNAGVGPSYIEAYNNKIDTSKVEATFRYEGVYTLYLLDYLYTSVSFTFQESPSSTYSEYYSLMYKLGYKF